MTTTTTFDSTVISISTWIWDSIQYYKMLSRKMITDALSDKSSAIKFIASISSKVVASEFKDLATLMTKEHEKFCAVLYDITTDAITELHVDNEDEERIALHENDEELVGQLRNIATVATIYTFDLPQYRPSTLLETISALHNILIPLDESIHGAQQLKTAVSRICEEWWVKDEPGADNLVAQLLPYLLICANAPDAYDSDVIRVFKIREALCLLDFDDENIGSLKGLLLRCFTHPAFLKVKEGNRFLAFLFSVSKGIDATRILLILFDLHIFHLIY